MKGIARRVRETIERQKTVLRFRLETTKGGSLSVEMRGAEIRGDIREGDTVELSAESTPRGHAVVRLSRVMNLTTDCIVEAWNPPLWQQAWNLVAKEALSAVVGAGATIIVGGLLRAGQTESAPPSTVSTTVPSTGTTSTTRVRPPPVNAAPPGSYLVLLLIVLAFAVYIAVRVRRRRRRHESLVPLLLALGAGIFLALLLLSLIFASLD
jgi:hypothetical protein